VSVVQGGGLVPITIETVADSASLSADDGDALRDRVEELGLLGLSSSAGEAQPDRPSFRITVEDEGRLLNQLSFDDAALPDAVRSFVSWVSSVPGHEEHVGPPGSS